MNEPILPEKLLFRIWAYETRFGIAGRGLERAKEQFQVARMGTKITMQEPDSETISSMT
ncbi:MAG: hypothetical protein H7A28_04565 [Thermotogae bacterium]|nr:hypothetical protein [Thermotogota bacterium]CCU86110.1 hypothetical protein PHOSAC3_90526 [Mesotoga infera]HOZ99732.1 hypothetical protein [Mesotoga prima]